MTVIPLGRREAVITGTGSAVPSRLVTNEELSASLGHDIAPLASGVLGIETRYWCAAHESTADLAEEAAQQALEMAQLAPEAIDLVILATDTPEYVTPATASVVQGRLGLVNAAAFDVNAACAGFVTALDVAWKYLRADERYARVLVIGVYAMSRYLDRHDEKTVTRIADGAGAVVVERRESPGILAAELFADGQHVHALGVFAGGTRTPITPAVLEAGLQNRLRFLYPYPASVTDEAMPRLGRAVLARAGCTPADVDLWLWTEMDRSTVARVMDALGEPMTRTHTVTRKWGYTGVASIPMALDDAVRSGVVQEGHLLMLTGTGAGVTMGAMAVRWRPSTP